MENTLAEKYNSERKTYVVVIMDGASDHFRVEGRSPLEIAKTPYLDRITEQSSIGLMQTLYPDLPKDSVVAQLGLLGYDPYKYFPKGRSYFEVPNGVQVGENDLVLRVNLVFFDNNNVLKSYNGFEIESKESKEIVDNINSKSKELFPEFELHNISDFRNTLIIKNVGKLNFNLDCYEPHEEEGKTFDIQNLVRSSTKNPLVDRINNYISLAVKNINNSKVNCIFPWGYSHSICLPKFSNSMKGCIIGNMDFLNGFAKEMDLEFCKVGNSNWNTDYKKKGSLVLEKIEESYDFIYCHINGPDEASHMNDVDKKIYSIEQIDQHILKPIFKYFETFHEQLGSITVCPDHYTNIRIGENTSTRRDAHSIDPVPFIVWDGKQKDDINVFSENLAAMGRYGDMTYNHLDLLKLMGIKTMELKKQENINCF